MSIIGPNGQDVYPVIITYKENGKEWIGAYCVTGLNSDEVRGKIHRIVSASEKRKLVSMHVGRSEISTVEDFEEDWEPVTE